MMIHVTRAAILMSISFIGVYLFQFSKSEEKMLYPSNCRPVIDSVFSEKLTQSIRSFIVENYDQKIPMQDLLKAVQEKFAAIRLVSVSLENSEALNIVIKGHLPCFLINNNLVVVENGAVLSFENFTNQSLSGLKNFYCADKLVSNNLQSNVLAFLKNISGSLCDLYSVRCESIDSIWFDHKEQKYSMLVTTDWDMNIDDVYLCQKIYERAVENQKEKKRKEKKDVRWVCDLRFKGQVVAYSFLQ